MKINSGYIIIGMILLATASYAYIQNTSQLKTASVLTGVSTLNYQSNTGQVVNGELYGSKMILNAKITELPLQILYSFAGKEQTWGNYKIIAKNNVLIKTSANPRAEYKLVDYAQPYYQAFSNVYQTRALVGNDGFVRIPLHIEIYSDTNSIPTTRILSRDIPDPCVGCDVTDLGGGQQLFYLGNGINLQQASRVQSGALLPKPATDFVVDTSPQFPDFQNAGLSDYRPDKSYIFNHASYDSKVRFFYDNIGSRTFTSLSDPLMSLWTGYYKSNIGICGSLGSNYRNGYCKLNGWDGLYKEVTQITANAVYNPSAQIITVSPIQYAADVVLELPSETVKSLAVLRGVGQPEVTYDVSREINQGDRLVLTVTVKNKGDSDGFSIVPTSTMGKLTYAPASYVSQYISAGVTKEFKFTITVSGKETSELAAREITNVKVQAEHNPTPVNINYDMSINYNLQNEVGDTPSRPGATVKPSIGSTTDDELTGEVTITRWYENAWLWIGLIIIIASLYYWRKQ